MVQRPSISADIASSHLTLRSRCVPNMARIRVINQQLLGGLPAFILICLTQAPDRRQIRQEALFPMRTYNRLITTGA
jgi:hypothetical protein